MSNDKNVPPMSPETPITKANLLAALAESLVELFGHHQAWRRFGAEVTGYLRERGLSEDFAGWQRKQQVAKIKDVAAKQRAKRTRGAID